MHLKKGVSYWIKHFFTLNFPNGPMSSHNFTLTTLTRKLYCITFSGQQTFNADNIYVADYY